MSGFFKRLFSRKQSEPDPMKYLIVGLGNIGAEYEGTRHNIGFEVLDEWVRSKEASYWMNP